MALNHTFFPFRFSFYPCELLKSIRIRTVVRLLQLLKQVSLAFSLANICIIWQCSLRF